MDVIAADCGGPTLVVQMHTYEIVLTAQLHETYQTMYDGAIGMM
jgi:hypothetical protein